MSRLPCSLWNLASLALKEQTLHSSHLKVQPALSTGSLAVQPALGCLHWQRLLTQAMPRYTDACSQQCLRSWERGGVALPCQLWKQQGHLWGAIWRGVTTDGWGVRHERESKWLSTWIVGTFYAAKCGILIIKLIVDGHLPRAGRLILTPPLNITLLTSCIMLQSHNSSSGLIPAQPRAPRQHTHHFLKVHAPPGKVVELLKLQFYKKKRLAYSLKKILSLHFLLV